MGLLSNMSSVMRKNEQVTIAGEDKKILLKFYFIKLNFLHIKLHDNNKVSQ